MDLSAVILAGGESRRMGRDKAWLEVDGRPLIARAVDTVRALGVNEVFVSGRAGRDYGALSCPVLLDREPGWGPLAGLERALHACSSPLLLVLAVDLPHMTSSFLRKLAARCQPRTGVVPQVGDGLEPLAAIYPRRCRVIASAFLKKNLRAARAFAETCLRERAVRRFPVAPADVPCFVNCNTPAALALARGASLGSSAGYGGEAGPHAVAALGTQLIPGTT